LSGNTNAQEMCTRVMYNEVYHNEFITF